MDKRWILVDIVPEETVTGVRYADAGTSAVNGDYYEDDPYAGNPTWTKVGGVYLEDSIHYEPTLSKFIITSGGTFAAATTNAKYDTPDALVENTAPFATWYVRDGSSTPAGGGTLPAPGTITLVEDLSYVNPEETTILRVLDCKTPCKFVDEADLSIGLIAKRRKLTTDLHFRGDDYAFFWGYERWSHKRCEELTIRREWKCGNRWKTFWTGTFSTGAGSWDLGRCEFTVRPDVKDEYTCLLRGINKKFNALDLSPVIVSAVIWPSTTEILLSTGGVGFYDEYLLADTQSLTIPAMGGACPSTTTTHNIWWRERIRDYPCPEGVLDGGPGAWTSSPPGTGWVPLGYVGTWPISVPSLMQDWVRQPTIAWPWANDPIVVGIDVVGDDVEDPEPTSPACGQWIKVGQKTCVGQHHVGLWICASEAEDFLTITRGRTMLSVLEYGILKTGCGAMQAESDFFEWDPPGDAPGYVAGENYVTQTTNEHDNWVLVQKSDAIDPAATNPAIKGEVTIKELLVLLSIGPRVFWRITEEGKIRFEHWSYWTYPVGLDLTAADPKKVVEHQAFTHLKAQIPRLERPKWMEAQGPDFVGVDIEYSGPCVTDEDAVELKEYNAGQFTTDLSFINTTPDAISPNGFALLATSVDGSTYTVRLAAGALTGSINTNATLSWANLERDFWMHDRFLPSGRMNNADTDFEAFVPNIEQKGVALHMCCDLFGADMSHRVETKLGNKLGQIKAFIQRVEIDDALGWVTFTLRYAY